MQPEEPATDNLQNLNRLPSYDEATCQTPASPTSVSSQGGPPSYDSIYGRIRQVETSNANLTRKVSKVVAANGAAFLLFCLVTFALPLAMLIMGAIKLKECEGERNIPIYLVVFGVFGIVKGILWIIEMKLIYGKRMAVEEGEEKKNTPLNLLQGVITLFLFVWFLIGSYWIYRIHNRYGYICDEVLYTFAFWVQTIFFIMLALLVGVCCIGCSIVCLLAILCKGR